MRRWLKRNHATQLPGAHVVVDTETTPIPASGAPTKCVHLLRCGVARYFRFEAGKVSRQKTLAFASSNVFWDWLIKQLDKRRPLTLWAHNLGFDLTALRFWELLETDEFRLSAPAGPTGGAGGAAGKKKPWSGCLVTEDPPTIITVMHQGGAVLRCLDTMNWCPTSLADLGESLGMPKQPMPGEVASDEDWFGYCANDVEITCRVVQRILSFVADNDLGNFCPTIAGQSLHFYRHISPSIPFAEDDEQEHKALERRAYYQGERSVRFAGACVRPQLAGLAAMLGVPEGTPIVDKGPVYHVDVTSAYLAAMADGPFPVDWRGNMLSPTVDELTAVLRSREVIAEVKVSSGADPYPRRVGAEVYWSRGTFWTHLCGPELRLAIARGHVQAAGLVQVYVSMRPFDEFVRRVWSIRSDCLSRGDPFGARLAKQLGNCLHGRMAMRQHRWEIVPGLRHYPPWEQFWEQNPDTGAVETWRAVGGHVERPLPPGERPDSWPAVAAYTTCYHRLRMARYLEIAGPRDVLYVDVDALHVTEEGYQNLKREGCIADNELGKLKLVGVADQAIYYGVKDYAFGDKRVCSGLSKRAAPEPSGLWHQTDFLRLDSVIGAAPPAGPVSIDRRCAHPAGGIKGAVGPDGWVDPDRFFG